MDLMKIVLCLGFSSFIINNDARRLKEAVDKANADGHNVLLIRIHDFVNTLHDIYAHWSSTADVSIIEVINNILR